MLLSFRRLLRRPWYTAIAVVTVALSLAAAGVATALVRGLWLAPSTGFAADRMVRIWETSPDAQVPLPVAWPRVALAREASRSLDDVAAFSASEVTVQGTEPVRLPARLVTHNFFDLYGVRMLRGRDFDETTALSRAVILSEQTWREQFGRSEELLGTSVNLNGRPYSVIGIVPAGVAAPDLEARLWISLEPEIEYLNTPSVHRVQAVGRLRGEASVEDVRRELASPALAVAADAAGHEPRVESLDVWLYGDARQRGRWLILAAGCLLVVAVANWGSLAMTRSIELGREMAIREALGARQATGLRHAVLEQLALATLAFPVALWVAFVLSSSLGGLLQEPARVATPVDVLAWAPIVVMAAVACASIVFVSFAARRSERVSLDASLRVGGVGGRQRAGRLTAIVAGEVAAAVVLASLAISLLGRHAELSAVDPGFRTEGLTIVPMTLAGTSYGSSREVAAFYQRVQEELARHPSVAQVSAIDGLPIGENPGEDVLLVDGLDASIAKGEGVRLHNVLGDYFRVSGTALIEGRDFRLAEDPAAPVAIVSASLARAVWGTRSPIGARVKIARYTQDPWRLVIGVAEDIRNLGLAQTPGYLLYEPHSQFPRRQMTMMVRGTSQAALQPAALVSVLRAVDPAVPIQSPRSFDAVVRETIDTERREARAASGVALLVVLLACAGIFGIVSYLLTARRREMAVMAAMGASPRVLVQHALLAAARPALIGAIAGVALTLGLTMSLGLAEWNAGTGTSATLAAAAVIVVALLAALPPALRSGRVAPADVLRNVL